jgi:polysaccharide export outer membrane protein
MKYKCIMTSILILLMVGCSSTSAPPETTESNGRGTITTQEYRIGVDDVLSINVWGNQELSVQMPVRPDGMISMPLIGDVRAGGLTPTEVAVTIKSKLSGYIRNPNVTIILTELHSHEYLSRIRVTGAVETPLSLPYRQGMTVLDAVLEAGGLNDFASPNSTKLFRKLPDERTQIIEVKLGDILNKGRLSTNYILKPGDIISIPERLF